MCVQIFKGFQLLILTLPKTQSKHEKAILKGRKKLKNRKIMQKNLVYFLQFILVYFQFNFSKN